MLRRTLQATAFAYAMPLLAASDKRHYKIGACEWSLRKIAPGSMELAKQIGVDGVQPSMGTADNKMWLRQAEVQKRYLDAARNNGLQISGLGLNEMNRIALKSEPRAAIWLNDSIEVARALGVKVILVPQFFAGELKGDSVGLARTIDLLREVAPRAEKAGVTLGIENYLSAAENIDILERVGSPAVLVYYDVGNSTDKGYHIYKEIRLLGKRICELHFKDGHSYLGKGRIDFAKVREAVEEIGFAGWIQIEAVAPKDVLEDFRANLAYLRQFFPN